MTVDRTYIEVFPDTISPDNCNYLIHLFNEDDRKKQGSIYDDHIQKPLYLDQYKKSTDLHLDFTDDKDELYNEVILHLSLIHI